MSYQQHYGTSYVEDQGWDYRPPSRTSVSPISGTTSTASLHQAQYGRQIPAGRISKPERSVSPIKERRQASFSEVPPPPPKHRSQPRSPPRNYHGTSAAMPGYGNTGYGSPVTGLEDEDDDPLDSGMQTLRDIDNLYSGNRMLSSPSPEPEGQRRSYATTILQPPISPERASQPERHQHTYSASSAVPLMQDPGFSPAKGSPSPPRRAERGVPPPFAGNPEPYAHEVAWQRRGDGYDDPINPDAIVDNGSDDFDELPRAKRSMKRARVTGAEDFGSFRVFSVRHRNASAGYGAVPDTRPSYDDTYDSEKREYQPQRPARSGRRKWLWIAIALILVAGIVGGTAGGVLAYTNSHDSTSGDSSSSSSSSSSDSDSDLYTIDSSAVKALLDNPALHKVFPGMDYTPLNAQYPACLTTPPSQNNITLDVALIAQLTPSVRIYGTDCNQTQMVLASIDALGYNNTLQVWLGVWLGTNATTNDRQLDQMYEILRSYPAEHFAGIIVGNEVLFREDMTITELGKTLADVRSNLTALSIDLPVATSDLGDDWTLALAQDSDIVMANVHPFFAGVKPDAAPGWTYEFWQTHDVVLAQDTGSKPWPRSIISEVGWPSEGGNDCGTKDGSCPDDNAGAVASIENMNEFMEGFVCQSLANGTTFFWFEAFDEPWKHQFDTETDKWESKWGLMNENRKVKEGLKIPDCGGRTVDKAY